MRILANEVGKEKDFEDGEHDKQLDQYHSPERLAQGHVPEPIIV